MPAFRAGAAALTALSASRAAVVLGATSRGWFLLLDGQAVVFLSVENYAGPLTLNLPGGLPTGVTPGATVELTAGRIDFPKLSFFIDYAQAEPWRAPNPPLARPDPDLPARVAAGLLRQRPAAGLAPLVREALDLPVPPGTLPGDEFAALHAPVRALFSRPADPTPLLISLLGAGRGLTPSGDDLVGGWLLARARRGEPFSGASDLLQAARRRTGALSTCLLAEAAHGEADERLLTAADGVIGGGDAGEIVAALLAYGASSGIDAFLGMLLSY